MVLPLSLFCEFQQISLTIFDVKTGREPFFRLLPVFKREGIMKKNKKTSGRLPSAVLRRG